MRENPRSRQVRTDVATSQRAQERVIPPHCPHASGACVVTRCANATAGMIGPGYPLPVLDEALPSTLTKKEMCFIGWVRLYDTLDRREQGI